MERERLNTHFKTLASEDKSLSLWRAKIHAEYIYIFQKKMVEAPKI